MTRNEADKVIKDIDEFIYENSSGSCRPGERMIELRNDKFIEGIKEIINRRIE